MFSFSEKVINLNYCQDKKKIQESPPHRLVCYKQNIVLRFSIYSAPTGM